MTPKASEEDIILRVAAKPLSILDLMIVIATIALALAVDRFGEGPRLSSLVDILAFRLLRSAILLLGSLNAAMVMIWVRRFRRSTGWLVRQPGFTGPAVATATALLLGGCSILLTQSGIGFACAEDLPVLHPILYWIFAGIGVAAAWAWQGVIDRWEPLSCSLDRMGRLLGLLTISGPVLFALISIMREASRWQNWPFFGVGR
jgi:hypothetical protein